MSAVLRVWWTFFTATPMQRWLGAVGCTLLVLGVGGSFLSPHRSGSVASAGLGLVGFLIFTILPTIVMAGGLLRALSAPSSHRLYPRLRPRLLLSVGLLIATIAAALVAFAVAWPDAFPAFALPSVVVAASAGSSATIFAFFVITRDVRLTWLIFAFYLAIHAWWKSGGADSLRAAGWSMTTLGGALTVAAWIVFAVTYLRAARIGPMRVMTTGGEVRALAGSAKTLPRTSAARSVLGAKVERPLPQALLMAVGGGVVIALTLALLSVLLGARARHAPLVSFLWPCAAMFGVGALGERAVRQSRWLWLRTGGPRRETLRVTEGFLTRLCLLSFVVVITVAVLSPLVWRGTPLELVLLVAASASAALCAGYVVLFALGSAWISIVSFLTLLLAQVTFLEVLRSSAPVWGPVALIGSQLGAAAVLRSAAIRRWRTIDWLKFKPVREPRVL